MLRRPVVDSGTKNVHENTTMKANWQLELIKEETLVVSDSLFRNATKIPRGIHLQCFPGARLENIARVLEQYNGPTIKTVVIAAGINNRDVHDVGDVYRHLDRAVRASNNIADEVVVAQVLFKTILKHVLPGGLAGLNRYIRRYYWTLRNPHARKIRTQPDGLHLTTTTIDSTLSSWASQMHL